MYKSILISDELRGYLPLLCRFLSGESCGLNPEKLRVPGKQNIYSLRVSQSSRLLYTRVSLNGERCLVVIGEVVSHDYQKSKFLRATGVLEAYLKTHRDNIESALTNHPEESLYSALSAGEELPEDTSISAGEGEWSSEVVPNYHSLTAFGARFFFQDAHQEESMKQSHASTLIVSGSSGTGKTVAAMLYLASHAGSMRTDGTPKRYLYVTLNPGLVAEVRKQLTSALSPEQLSPIQCITYKELVQASKPGVEIRYLDRLQVQTCILNALKSMTQYDFGSLETPIEKAKVIHHEWTLIAGLNDESSYLALGHDQSYIHEDETRKKVYQQYQLFNKSLQENEIYLPFHKFKASNERYDGMIIDEAFLLSFANVSGLKAQTDFSMLLCDSHQATGGHWLSVFSSQCGGVASLPLRENHRNPHSVIEMLNRVLKIKFFIRAGLRDKYEQGVIPNSSARSEEVLWIDKAWCESHQTDVSNWVASSKFAVVILCDEASLSPMELAAKKARAREIFNTPLVLTRKEAQGLEYPVIAIMMDESISPLTQKLERGFSSKIANQLTPAHRAAEKGVTWPQQEAMDVCNQLYVGCSRAQSRLIVYVDEQLAPAEELISYLKGENTSPAAAPKMQRSSHADWQEEAARQDEKGNHSIIEAILRQHNKKNDLIKDYFSQIQLELIPEIKLKQAEAKQTSPDLIPPKEFNAGWNEMVKKFKDPKFLIQENLNQICNKKNNALINWVLFVAEVEEGKKTSIFIKFLEAGKGEHFLEWMNPHWDKVNSLGLNYLSQSTGIYSGYSLVFFLCLAAPHGVEVLNAKPELTSMIERKSFNALLPPSAGICGGIAAVCCLCTTTKGVALLLTNPELANKIDSTALNAIFPPSAGEKAWQSAAYYLCGTIQGIAILKNNPELINKLSSEAINTILPSSAGLLAGTSAGSVLCERTEGIELLITHRELAAKLSSTALNQILPPSAGNRAGLSAAFFLCRPEGVKLLISNKELAAKLDSVALNWILPASSGIFTRTSGAYFLCSTKEGIALLMANPELANKLDSEAINARLPRGESAAFFLLESTEGQTLLESNPKLAAKVQVSKGSVSRLVTKSMFHVPVQMEREKKTTPALRASNVK